MSHPLNRESTHSPSLCVASHKLVINYITCSFAHSGSEQLLSECEGVHHTHNYYVPNCGSDGDPQPNGVPGHGLGLLRLAMSCQGSSMDAGRRVEQRVVGAVVIVGRRVHEGARHHWNLWTQKTKDNAVIITTISSITSISQFSDKGC